VVLFRVLEVVHHGHPIGLVGFASEHLAFEPRNRYVSWISTVAVKPTIEIYEFVDHFEKSDRV
jgi:hypothetical protein